MRSIWIRGRLRSVSKRVEIVQGALPEILASGSRAVLATVIMLNRALLPPVDGARVVEWAGASRRSRPADAGADRGDAAVTARDGHRHPGRRRCSRAWAAEAVPVPGFPHAAFFGMLTAMVSSSPGVEPAWCGSRRDVALAGGRHVAAVLLALYCLGRSGGREAVGKPLCSRGRCRMHTGLIFLSLLGGLACSGCSGSCSSANRRVLPRHGANLRARLPRLGGAARGADKAA